MSSSPPRRPWRSPRAPPWPCRSRHRPAVAVADDHEGGEAEATTTLHDLGDTVDRDDALDVGGLVGAGRRDDRRGRRRRSPPAPPPRAGLRSCRTTSLSLSCSSCDQNPRPPSRAPSARAAMRPWYLLPARSKTTPSTPAALARSATSSPTFLALAVLSPSTRAQVGLHGGGRGQRLAGQVVDDLGDDVLRRPGDDQPRTLGGAGDLLADPDLATQPRRRRAPRCACACAVRSPWSLTSLSDLAADVLAGVPHALALVGLGLAQLADVGGDLADLLLVDALDTEPGRRSRP